ncbi:hypothetical protein MNBD_GAMMA12-2600 [hydrothermal vent metagenome]|uniref:Uncharacterized protein n=1 Tax=hydrothermal vent metagenome TaxID=652676 RepID=A0A3B0Z672_9ZZZZ
MPTLLTNSRLTHGIKTISISLAVLLMVGCAQNSAGKSGKGISPYIPVAFQKKKDPKPILRITFFGLYGEYSKKDHPYPPRVTKITTTIKGKFIYIDITISPGCFVERRTLSLNLRDSPFTKFPLQVNKHYEVFKIFRHDKKSYFYTPSDFELEKLYARQVSFRFPLKLLLKYPNQLQLTHMGLCYNRKKHKRQLRHNDYKNIVYNAKNKTIKLMTPKDRFFIGDPDDPSF